MSYGFMAHLTSFFTLTKFWIHRMLNMSACGCVYICMCICMYVYKSVAIPIQSWTGPYGSRRLRLPEFLDSWLMKVVRLSALPTGLFYPQEICMYLYVYMYICMYIHTYIHTCMHTYMYICMYVHTYACVCVCACVCVYVYSPCSNLIEYRCIIDSYIIH